MSHNTTSVLISAILSLLVIGVVIALALAPSPEELCGKACAAGGGRVHSFIDRSCICEPTVLAPGTVPSGRVGQ